jgi:hypothetical protein
MICAEIRRNVIFKITITVNKCHPTSTPIIKTMGWPKPFKGYNLKREFEVALNQ